MRTILWAESVKLKRSKILWIAFFSAVMVALIVFMQGQFTYYGRRYIDTVGWYMTAAQSLGSLYVLPALVALVGSYLICREDQEDTMKSLVLIPVSRPKLIGTKMIVTALLAVLLYAFLFMVTLVTEVALHGALLDARSIFRFARIYLVEGIGIFLAVSPVIAIVSRLKKSYWLALLFAEIYSFGALFAGMQQPLRSIYPVTAAFTMAGYYEAVPGQAVLSLCSLLACGVLSLILLRGLNKQSDV